jgi:putative ABC transport system permease protein
MTTFFIRRIRNNKWLFSCLLLGMILSTALISSISINTSALLNRSLVKEIEVEQGNTNRYIGGLSLTADFRSNIEPDQKSVDYNSIRDNVAVNIPDFYNLKTKDSSLKLAFGPFNSVPQKMSENQGDKKAIDINSMSGIEDHITILSGRMFKKDTKETAGVVEAVITQAAMRDNKFLLDSVYNLSSIDGKFEDKLKIKIVGVFTCNNESDIYWANDLDQFQSSILIDHETAITILEKAWAPLLEKAEWYYAFDYNHIKTAQISDILETYSRQQILSEKYNGLFKTDFQLIDVLKKYTDKGKQIKISLLVLNIPIILMLFMYIFMLSGQLLKKDKNEISLLQGRGASSLQIFLLYLFEGIIFAAISFAIGPFIGLWLCRLLGISGGFLEFVNRTGMQFSLSTEAYVYSAVTALLMVINIIIPVIPAARITIITHKQRISRFAGTPLWKKTFIDVILLAISVYGVYKFHSRQNNLINIGAKGVDIQVDPLLFISSTLFIVGGGLLLLRVFPYLMKLLLFIREKTWSPVCYSAFVQVGRSGGKEQFIMIFLILTIATGIFNANSARTINQNVEEKVKYEQGADVVLDIQWETNKTPDSVPEPKPETIDGNPLHYKEPNFSVYTKLSGVESATRVLQLDDLTVMAGEITSKNVNLMGLDPYDFSNTIWFRNGLLPHHINNYLNLMSYLPEAFLVSSSFRDRYGMRVGDKITASSKKQKNQLKGYIYGFIEDFWPSFNPYIKGSKDKTDLIVANLDYVYSRFVKTPYDIWIKKKPGIADTEIDSGIKKKSEESKQIIKTITYTNQIISDKKKDTTILSINGSATTCFIVSFFVCFIGFLIYWVLSIRQRLLYFGILRAIGLKRQKVTRILILEQLLITGPAIAFGVILGGVASRIFVPFLQMIYGSSDLIPPFKVVSYRGDMLKIYVVLGIMLITGILILGRIVSKLKVSQIVKLGED